MTIENTSSRDPLVHLVGGLGGLDRYIGEMEKAGQSQVVASELIPTDRRGITNEELSTLGFVLGSTDEDDPLFQHAALPVGWAKKPTDHDMWSDIVDDEGRVRFNVFYKAAFYDRSAHMSRAR